MGMQDIITTKLLAAFAPESVHVEDESHLHEGHAGHPDLKGFGDGKHATWVLDPDGHDIEVVHKS